jgi:hypothetical protein
MSNKCENDKKRWVESWRETTMNLVELADNFDAIRAVLWTSSSHQQCQLQCSVAVTKSMLTVKYKEVQLNHYSSYYAKGWTAEELSFYFRREFRFHSSLSTTHAIIHWVTVLFPMDERPLNSM